MISYDHRSRWDHHFVVGPKMYDGYYWAHYQTWLTRRGIYNKNELKQRLNFNCLNLVYLNHKNNEYNLQKWIVASIYIKIDLSVYD